MVAAELAFAGHAEIGLYPARHLAVTDDHAPAAVGTCLGRDVGVVGDDTLARPPTSAADFVADVDCEGVLGADLTEKFFEITHLVLSTEDNSY